MWTNLEQVDKLANAPPRLRLAAVSLLLCCVCVGCANLNRKVQSSDGLIDFIWAVAGSPRRDVVPVERVSGRPGEIVSAHAEADHAGGTYVSGSLRNGFGYNYIYDAHIDVRVLGSDRRVIAVISTDYFPRPIPSDYHGTVSRGWFSVRLPFVPTVGSTIQVIFHQASQEECELLSRKFDK